MSDFCPGDELRILKCTILEEGRTCHYKNYILFPIFLFFLPLTLLAQITLLRAKGLMMDICYHWHGVKKSVSKDILPGCKEEWAPQTPKVNFYENRLP